MAVLWAVLAVAGYVMFCSGEPDETPVSAEVPSLTARVAIQGGRFVVANLDSVPWRDVEFDLNGGAIRSGFIYRANEVEAGGVYTIGTAQFAKSDGTRFNPITMKALRMCITAKAAGSTAVWCGSFE